MAALIARQLIDQAESELEGQKCDYLRKFGWDRTCNTPGAYWLWRRDFAPEDAERMAQQVKHNYPTPPTPYGVITADTSLAVSITRSSLDCEIEQDGDPESPVITAEDLPED